jgi:hypothetical protein
MITLGELGIAKVNMEDLNFRLKSLLKGIAPEKAYAEVERIRSEYGEITAKILLDVSRNKDSVFHDYFNWNDADAAEKYRLRQARDLLKNIQVNIVSDGEARNVRVYEIVKRKDGEGIYKNIETLTSDDVEYVRQQVVKALMSYRNKLATYDQFKLSVKHLDNAISELEVLATVEVAG